MKIHFDNSFYEIGTVERVVDILDYLKIGKRTGIAVSINNMIVSSNDWNKIIRFSENDEIFIIKATQGG